MDGLDRLALVVYPLLMSRGGTHVVSNGEQTEPVLDALHGGETLERALESWTASWMSLPRYGSPVPSTSTRRVRAAWGCFASMPRPGGR